MPFAPRQSGNLLGRPRVGLSLAAAMRRKFPPDRIVELAEKLATTADDERVRMVALQFIAERAYGKIVSAPDHDEDDDAIGVSAFPLKERRAMLTAMTKMAAVESPLDEPGVIDVDGD